MTCINKQKNSNKKPKKYSKYNHGVEKNQARQKYIHSRIKLIEKAKEQKQIYLIKTLKIVERKLTNTLYFNTFESVYLPTLGLYGLMMAKVPTIKKFIITVHQYYTKFYITYEEKLEQYARLLNFVTYENKTEWTQSFTEKT